MENWIQFVLTNFPIVMLGCAAFFMLINRLAVGSRVSQYEVVYRWMALFTLGFTGIYTFIMGIWFPTLAASNIGWLTSPFQYEIAMANLAFGTLGILSFNSNYGFRLATTLGATIWLWGDAINHIHQLVVLNNYTIGNAGPWLWMDILTPLLLLICVNRLKPGTAK